jgi:hypothetical protein
LQLEPSFPTALDSIFIKADFFDQQGVDSVFCEVMTFDRILKMIPIDNDNISFRSEAPIEPQNAGTVIGYRFHIYDSLGIVTISDNETFMVNGPDLIIKKYEMTSHNTQPVFKVIIDNVGTTSSSLCQLKLYLVESDNNILLSSVDVPSLEILEQQDIYLPIQNATGRQRFKIVVNENQESFSEINATSYQSFTTPYYDINIFTAGIEQVQAQSLDGNLLVTFAENLLPENYLFSIDHLDDKVPLNQPDIGKIPFATGAYSPVYEVKAFDESIFVDSMQVLPNESEIILEFSYEDNKNQRNNSESDYAVYRWYEPYEKWLFMGGAVDPDQNKVTLYSNKLGVFALFANNDDIQPTIQVNAQGQEFSQENYHNSSNPDEDIFTGGYVSQNAILSIILSDANGIDAFMSDIIIGIDGIPVQPEEYSISLVKGNLTSIPIKFKLKNLAPGDHDMDIACTDVNGKYKSTENIRLRIYKDFSVQNFANYPNPVKSSTEYEVNEGRTRFTYVLTEDADNVKIKIYTVSGRLVKTFHNLPTSVGYHEYPRTQYGWDCRDDEGFFLANGVYFYKIIAQKGSKKIEKMQKMAILK